jgi:predicted metallo-beta-lactamase superfamily hydrolase
MKIKPIAFDSFGARSMCTLVETEDVAIIIDPSVALGPKRYGLPPHEIEIKRKDELWQKIKLETLKADIVIITHYHYDHHNPNEPEILSGKILLTKHPKIAINRSQMGRSAYFLEKLKELENPPIIDFADSKSYEFGKTCIEFSKPVFHGADSKLGYVLEVCIDDGKNRFVYTSDVEGATNPEQIEFIIRSNPDVVFMDGPMTYISHVFGKKLLEKSIENLSQLIEKTNVREIVLDHHLTRDIKWKDQICKIFAKADEHGVKIESAAEFGGIKEELLEAMRKKLYISQRKS